MFWKVPMGSGKSSLPGGSTELFSFKSPVKYLRYLTFEVTALALAVDATFFGEIPKF